MADGRFRWGPFAALVGLAAAGIYGWLYSGWVATDRQTAQQTPVQVVGGTPVPPPPPQAVRPEPLPPARVPSFDSASVTVQPNGSVSVSGTVDREARLSLVANGVVVAEATADGEGRFALGPSVALAPGTTEFRIRSILPDGRTAISQETLTVIVPRTTAEAFVVTLAGGSGPPRELSRVDPRPVLAPDFGGVRIEPNGSMTTEGQVDGGARVTLLGNGREVASAMADGAGRFRLGPTPPLEPGVTRFELRSTHPDARSVMSADRIIVDVPAVPGGAFAATREVPGQPAQVVASRPAEPSRVPRFETVDVQPNGVVTAGGTVEPSARVGLVANGQLIAEAASDASGAFRLGPTQPLSPGETGIRLRSVLGDGRTATSEERLVVQVPRGPNEPFQATIEVVNVAPRVLARVEPAPIPPPAPRFEIVRVEPDGTALFAGRSEPNARIALLSGQTVLADATVGPSRDWSVVPREPFPPGTTELRLRATSADGRASTISGERLSVIFPRVAGESFGAVLESPNEAPRIVARGAALARAGIAAPPPPPPVPIVTTPAPIPPGAFPPPPDMPGPPVIDTVTTPPSVPRVSAPVPPTVGEPAPTVRANVPPPPRRALPDREIK